MILYNLLSDLFFFRSDPNERAHFWIPESSLTSASELLDTSLTERMYIDSGEVVRLRVEADDFCDDEPGPTKVSEGVATGALQPRRAPYVICVNEWFFRLVRFSNVSC